MSNLFDELHSLTVALNAGSVEYALCGGLALAVHGHPRATVDIDILVPPQSLRAAIAVANAQGYSIVASPMVFSGGAIHIHRISKVLPGGTSLLTLDILLVTPEVHDVWLTRTVLAWNGGTIPVVSRSGLIALKRLSARPQDLADIARLEEGASDATR